MMMKYNRVPTERCFAGRSAHTHTYTHAHTEENGAAVEELTLSQEGRPQNISRDTCHSLSSVRTYIVSSGTLNSSIPYHTLSSVVVIIRRDLGPKCLDTDAMRKS